MRPALRLTLLLAACLAAVVGARYPRSHAQTPTSPTPLLADPGPSTADAHVGRAGAVPSAPLALPRARGKGDSSHSVCVVSGVVHEADGTPAAGVQVKLLSLRPPHQPEKDGAGTGYAEAAMERDTDDDGTFTIEIDPGDYLLFAASEGRSSPPIEPLTLSPGEEVRGLELVLAPAQVLAGLVVERDGTPAEASVIVRLAGASTAVFDGDTDEKGAFELGQAPNHPLVLVATSHKTGATVELTLAAPQPDLVVRLGRPAAPLTVQVIDAIGAPVPDVNLFYDAGNQGGLTSTDDNGLARLEVAARSVTVEASLGEMVSERTTFPVGVTASIVQLRLVRGAVLTGRVRMADGTTARGIAVLSEEAHGGRQQASLEPDGSYRFEGLRAGDYSVSVLEQGGEDPVTTDAVRAPALRTGDERALPDLVLAAMRRVTGRVLDETGAPIANATIEVVDARGSSAGGIMTRSGVRTSGTRTIQLYEEVGTDRDGRFVIEHARGTLRLRASSSESSAVSPIQLVAAGEDRVTLTLRAVGNVDGILRGRFAAGTQVRCSGGVWHPVDAAGKYHLQCGLDAQLEVQSGDEVRRFPVEVDEDEPTYVELRWET